MCWQHRSRISIPGKVKFFIPSSKLPNCLLSHTAFCSILTAVCHYTGTYVTVSRQHYLLAHRAFCSILTAVCHYTGTYVTVSRQHYPQTFIHKFRRPIRLLAKTTISFVMTVCLSVHPLIHTEELGYWRVDFYEILYLKNFRKPVEKKL